MNGLFRLLFFAVVVRPFLLNWTGGKATFMEDLTCRMTTLAAEGNFPAWVN